MKQEEQITCIQLKKSIRKEMIEKKTKTIFKCEFGQFNCIINLFVAYKHLFLVCKIENMM